MRHTNRPLEYGSTVRPILKFINSLPDGKAINIHGSVYSERGTPDIIGSVGGRSVAFECKRDDMESPELVQQWRLSEWLSAGSVVGCVSSVDHVKLILQLMGVI